MQGIADIFLSFFYFPGPAYPQYLLRPFCRPPTASRRAAVPIADEKPSLHAALGGFPLSHRMRKRIGGVRRTLSARLFPKKYDRQCFAGKLPPPSPDAARQKESRKPAKVSGSRIVFGDYLLNSATDFCAAATLSPAVTFLRASIACGFISLALYAAPRMK